MKWLIVPLTIQTLAGIALAFRSVSLNMWEANDGINDRSDWLSLVTGVVFLTGAGLGWYGYSQGVVWCWGLSGFRLLKSGVDATGLVLLWFVLFRAKPSATEAQEERSAESLRLGNCTIFGKGRVAHHPPGTLVLQAKTRLEFGNIKPLPLFEALLSGTILGL
jgi:hypothetical protein